MSDLDWGASPRRPSRPLPRARAARARASRSRSDAPRGPRLLRRRTDARARLFPAAPRAARPAHPPALTFPDASPPARARRRSAAPPPRRRRADDEEFEVPDLAKETEAKAKIASDPRFADEDAEEDEPAPVAKKPEVKKKTVAQYVDETLDDPVAEKARRQKLVEEADLAAAKELFGTDGEEIDLTTYNPKSAKEFTKFGTLLASKFLIPIKESAFFKETIKAFVKSAMKYMTVVDIKEVEATVVAMRNEKVKAEKAEAIAAQKATAAATAKAGKGKKKFLNQGTKGGDDGLSDFKYANHSVDDDYDFM